MKQYNSILRELYGWKVTNTQTTTRKGSITGLGFFFSRMVQVVGVNVAKPCSNTTAAGWGWCYKNGDIWAEAYGPVVTDADHFHFHGAQVGSNNTGELTVILEAVLHAISENWESITIRSDSQWSIKVIQGIWKVRHYKTLVNYIKRLIRSTSLEVSLTWIKGHAGHHAPS